MRHDANNTDDGNNRIILNSMSHVICDMSYIASQMSYIICHMSHIVCHVSYYMFVLLYVHTSEHY